MAFTRIRPALFILTLLVVVTLPTQAQTPKNPWHDRGHLADDPERGIRWRKDLAAAKADARRLGKPLLIVFAVRKQGNPAIPPLGVRKQPAPV